jgi:hypothetical protein
MFRVALTWLVLTLTGSGEKMGLVEFLNQCPVFFIGLFIGVFLDGADLRKVLICTQIAMIAQSLLLDFLVYTGNIRAWTTVVFRYQEWNRAKQTHGPDKIYHPAVQEIRRRLPAAV